MLRVSGRTTSGCPTVAFAASRDFERTPEILQGWNQLLEATENLYALYCSPPWFDHLLSGGDEHLFLAVARNEGEALVGIAPVRVGPYDLKFDVKGYTLGKTSIRAATLLGSQPLLPPDAGLHDQLFTTLARALPACEGIYLHSVPTASYCWDYLQTSPTIRGQFLLYLAEGGRPFHALVLPPTFEEYLAKFKPKKRYNLKRQVRLLRDHGGGLQMLRIETPDQVPEFLEAATTVVRQSGRHKGIGTKIETSPRCQRGLADLAHR